MAIRGGSAGGYTTLCALVFHHVFAAGASHYGVGDLESLARDTHKFESRYLDRLIGPYPAAAETYRNRSPIHFAHQISCPVIMFQGLEDRVVPPNQSEAFAAAVRSKGLSCEYVTFPDEGHGFRRAENIQRAAEAELAFYGRVFGFPGDM
jgi:dipeptidyl aminopeptidase/acylaminoacyl peptidase